MKDTTKKIYDKITTDIFVDIRIKLNDIINKNNWQIADKNEYSVEELKNDLPELIYIIQQTIEDNILDTLPYQTRVNLFSSLNNIYNYLEQIYRGNNQFAPLMEQVENVKILIRSNRLDFESKRIPMYREKIKEYKELSSRLEILIEEVIKIKGLKENSDTRYEQIKEINEEIISISKDISDSKEKIDNNEEEISQILNNSKDNLKAIENNKLTAKDELEEIKQAKIKVLEIEENIVEFYKKIETYEENMSSTTEKINDRIEEYSKETREIISKNKSQTEEINNQLERALGASLFSSFSKRKENLNESLNRWLLGIAASIIIIIGLSIWMYYDLIGSKKMDIYYFYFKLALAIPFVFIVGFCTNRYSKERRLVEEYAFKSTISLSLKPFADLVNEIADEGENKQYKEFLIESINKIFNDPNDKVFGKIDKSNISDPYKLIEKALNIVANEKVQG